MNRLMSRRTVLGTAGLAAASCAGAKIETALPAPVPEMAPVAPAIPVEAAPAAPIVVAPVPAPPPARPSLVGFDIERIVQPVWSAGGERVLFYDQPESGLGGTWVVDPLTGQIMRERAQWGYYVAGGTLLATPRPAQRDTYILHVPSGREWTLPTSNSTVFSSDGTVVAYNATTQTRGGGGSSFRTTTVVVSGADGQDSRHIPLPINGSALAWLPGPDGTPNTRLLLSGRRSRPDMPALWVLDVRDRSLHDLFRSRRLAGMRVSPDGTWVAFLAMWNADSAQDGLWLMRTDSSERRLLGVVGSFRWTDDNRLLIIPARASASDSHEVWQVQPSTGEAGRLSDPAETPFRMANFDWDLSPDGTRLTFVSAGTKQLAALMLPNELQPATGPLPQPPVLATGRSLYRLPFIESPGPSSWYVAQWYGITTGGYRGRNSVYREGQGIHFGIDFPASMGTPVVAMAPGRVLAVDGDYGSPPHNVVLQLADGNQVMYGHLAETSRHVQVGQWVDAGQVVGNTGDSSFPYDGNGNPHLHLEIRKRGRSIATNPVPYVDTNWDDMSFGVSPGARFERDLDNPKRHQFLDDQPDIWFGGPVISNFARAWPP